MWEWQLAHRAEVAAQAPGAVGEPLEVDAPRDRQALERAVRSVPRLQLEVASGYRERRHPTLTDTDADADVDAY